MQTSADDEQGELTYLRDYAELCWAARQHSKDELSKLLYWLGSGFVGIVAVTGLLGAARPSGSGPHFTLTHILVFHTAAAVVWCFFKYKQLNSELFERLGLSVEKELKRRLKVSSLIPIPPIFEVKGHYLGDSRLGGRGLSTLANILIMALYVFGTVFNVGEFGADASNLKINWNSLCSGSVLFIVLYAVQIYYKRRREKCYLEIDKEWAEAAAKRESASGSGNAL